MPAADGARASTQRLRAESFDKDRPMKTLLSFSTLAVALGTVTACGSIGGERPAPDEFKVVTKAPLTVPPEYALRPPEAGQARPPEVDPDLNNVTFAFGQNVGENASEVEKRAVREAGAIATDPVVRAQIDYENAKIIRKPGDFADEIMSAGDQPEGEATDSATGGGDIRIEGARGAVVKLPGT
jgi:hypothetical protein